MKLVQCWLCHGDGKVPCLHNEKEVWLICENCQGEGAIPDPDEFVNTLSDLVAAKEQHYEH